MLSSSVTRFPAKAGRLVVTMIAAAGLVAGCQSGPVARMLAKPDRTTFRTPTVRTEEARTIASQATGQQTPEQQELLNTLARSIQTESDPLVREALIESIARFPMPLADQVIEAGLNDPDAGVRRQCCESLGQRGKAASAPALARVVRGDENLDVRLSATQALGGIKAPESATALVAALEDDSPALQYAAVQSMRSVTGKDFGGDVAAYLAYAKGDETPVVAAKPESGAGGFLRRFSPF